MLYLTEQTKILLSPTPVDFRKQIDGFVALCKNHLKQSPNSGNLFVFINKSNTMIRALSYDGTGYWLATKRLSKGHYAAWPKTDNLVHPLQATELIKIIKGVFAPNK